ncbi:MAG: hypothetical protein ACT4QE_25765 [Anaerolineales bacterium]
MFAKHLPPSAGLPRVLVLDEEAAHELPPEIERVRVGEAAEGETADAVVGHAAPNDLARWFTRLRPGGRLILAVETLHATSLLTALTDAGYTHCLVEPHGALTLYRGERPPLNSSVERVQKLSAHQSLIPFSFVFLLITQTPNKPPWKLAPDETLTWRAATVIDPATDEPVLLAFTSLVKAVAFMQPAVLAQFIIGVNKVGKFTRAVAEAWPLPFVLNPDFEEWRAAARAGPFAVDPQSALTNDE